MRMTCVEMQVRNMEMRMDDVEMPMREMEMALGDVEMHLTAANTINLVFNHL